VSKKISHILIVEDDRELRISMFEALNGDYRVSVAENGFMALEIIDKGAVDLVISDIRMPEMSGLELLQKLRISSPNIPVVIVTGFASVDTAVEAMKKGAYDYILKPFPLEMIDETVRRALESGRQNSNSAVAGILQKHGNGIAKSSHDSAKPVIGEDPAWLGVIKRAQAVASSTATVLILGESGTGKEVLARFIHRESDRRDGPFVALNCAALPEGLLESELFGHERGAFTGAVSAKKGKFELAEGGTLLLDEIGEVPIHLQAKLLRVLQEEEVDRLGGKGPIKFNVHVIATTNRDLQEAVEKGEFRQDLFYRLNVIPLQLPALRDRPGDVLRLADSFGNRYAKRYKKPLKKISEAARQRLLAYSWPGNVREVENMLERAVLLSNGPQLESWDLWDEEAPAGAPTCVVKEQDVDSVSKDKETMGQAGSPQFIDASGQMISLHEAERQMIIQALQKTDNNRTHAAKILGISVRTLRNKLHEYRSSGLLS